jgi:hypothetical protein
MLREERDARDARRLSVERPFSYLCKRAARLQKKHYSRTQTLCDQCSGRPTGSIAGERWRKNDAAQTLPDTIRRGFARSTA